MASAQELFNRLEAAHQRQLAALLALGASVSFDGVRPLTELEAIAERAEIVATALESLANPDQQPAAGLSAEQLAAADPALVPSDEQPAAHAASADQASSSRKGK